MAEKLIQLGKAYVCSCGGMLPELKKYMFTICAKIFGQTRTLKPREEA